MSRSKGNRNRRKAIKYLKEDGWLVDVIELTGKFRKYKDAFAGYCVNCWERTDDDEGCCEDRDLFDGFDIMGLKEGRCCFVQIKSNTPPTQRGFKKFAKRFASHAIEVWCCTWYDYQGWRIQKYKPNGEIEELDLR